MPATSAIVSYCATFLPREMLHVYRQVYGVRSFDHWVVTRRRAHAADFPFPQVIELRKSPWRVFNRAWHRALGRRVPVSRSEINQMLCFCERQRVALTHIYLGGEALRVLPFLCQFGGARVVSFHGADLSDELDARAYTPLWPRGDLFLCRSQSLWERLLGKGCPPDRIRLNYTGVPVLPAVPVRRPPKWQTGEPVRLLQACRLVQKKGLDVALHTVKLLNEQGMRVLLTLAGEGPEETSLRALGQELGIDRSVSFTGFLGQERLQDAYREHHVFLHPSRTTPTGDREGIPNSLLEAMAAGLPVIATRHSGIPEAITHGEDGLLVEHADAPALATAIRELIERPVHYEYISRNAHKTVVKRFSLEANATVLDALYREAIEINVSGPK